MESDGRAESCVPVADEAAARAWAERTGETRVRVEPAARPAFTRIAKAQVAHPRTLAAFEAVEQWTAGQGLRMAGPAGRSASPTGTWRGRRIRSATWPSRRAGRNPLIR